MNILHGPFLCLFLYCFISDRSLFSLFYFLIFFINSEAVIAHIIAFYLVFSLVVYYLRINYLCVLYYLHFVIFQILLCKYVRFRVFIMIGDFFLGLLLELTFTLGMLYMLLRFLKLLNDVCYVSLFFRLERV